MSEKKRIVFNERSVVFFIFLIALIVRGAAWFQKPLISRDGIFYLWNAGSFAWQEKQTAPPLASLLTQLVAAAHIGGLDPEIVVAAVNMIAGALLVPVVYLIAQKCELGKWGAAGAALLIAVNPLAVEVSHMVQRESLFLLFCGLALAVLPTSANTRYTVGRLAGAGGACAIAFFARFEALEWLTLLGAVVVFQAILNRQLRRGGVALAILLSGFLIMFIIMSEMLRVPCRESLGMFGDKAVHYFRTGFGLK